MRNLFISFSSFNIDSIFFWYFNLNHLTYYIFTFKLFKYWYGSIMPDSFSFTSYILVHASLQSVYYMTEVVQAMIGSHSGY